MLPRIRRLLGDVAVEKGLMSSGGEGRFLDKNSGFMYPSHYELGPPPRLTKLAVRARREDDGTRLARMQVEYQAEREKISTDFVLAMVYWDQCTDEGYLPMTLKEVNRQLEEAGWARTQHFFSETAADLARQGIIKVTNGRDGKPFECYF